MTLSYNRRVRRPRSRFINPLPSRSSATNLFQGNPDLDLGTSNTFSIGFFKTFRKLSLTSSVYFQRVKDAFNFVALETDNFYIYETNQTLSINDPDFDDLNANFFATCHKTFSN